MAANTVSSITQGRVCRESRGEGVSLTETIHEAHLRLDEHAHHQATLGLVLAGGFEERVGDDRFLCEPMSLLYKPPGAPHSNRYGACGARTVLVSLDRHRLRELEALLPAGVQRPIQVGGLLAARALALVGSDGSGPPRPSLDWEELFAEVLDQRDRRIRDRCGRPPPWLDLVRDAVHDRFAEPLRLSILAEAAGVHPVHLARVYRRHHGCSIGEALRHRRVEHAIARLRAGAYDLACLALECGFADQSHLNREFKREVGTSPGRFRRRVLGLFDAPEPGASAR